MNVQTQVRRAGAASTKIAIADCDIHPCVGSPRELDPYLAKRWQQEFATFGSRFRHAFSGGPQYPKGQPDAHRRDARPPSGAKGGSDLGFMREQHLIPNDVRLGILNPLSPSGQGFQNPEFSAAYCTAMNDWQKYNWAEKEPRLKASVLVPYEDGAASAAEIRRRAGDPAFVQVLLLSRSAEPLGQRRYWPIYEAAAECGLPVAVHAFGYGGTPITGGGWPSYYIEEVSGHAQCCQALLTSMVIEGIFERFPGLKVVMVEAGFAWLPPLAWRMDKHWMRLRQETPHLKRKPSECIRDHVWIATQPMEEPDRPEFLRDTFEWIGWDRLLFATDYPHWDFDDPAQAIRIKLSPEERLGLFYNNAAELYGQPLQ
ncbi:MAG: amidohydrolase family protein [Acetobacterales bacterium]